MVILRSHRKGKDCESGTVLHITKHPCRQMQVILKDEELSITDVRAIYKREARNNLVLSMKEGIFSA